MITFELIVGLSVMRWLGPWAALAVIFVSLMRTAWISGAAFAHDRDDDATLEAEAVDADPRWRALVEDVTALCSDLNVHGQVRVVPMPEAEPGTAYAGVIRYVPTYSVVLVHPEFLNMARTHRLAILSHEVGHLQKRRPQVMRLLLGRAALPVAVALAVLAPWSFAVSVGMAVLAWFAVKMVAPALSRREERRADRVAYEYAGESFADALRHAHLVHDVDVMPVDFWWRLEDAWLTHPSLPNRLEDMRRWKPGHALAGEETPSLWQS